MMKPAAGVLLTPALLVAVAVPPAAGQPGGQSQAMVALHAGANNHKGLPNFCDDIIDLPCDRFVATWPLHAGANVYLVVALADSVLGVSGVSFGIMYQDPDAEADGVGVDMFGYRLCGDFESPQSGDGDPGHVFPASGGGNRILWDPATNCQRHVVEFDGVQAVACVFYVYAYGPDDFVVFPNPAGADGPELQVVGCVGPTAWDRAWWTHTGAVGFRANEYGGEWGYNPCIQDILVKATTWGKLKSQYRQ